MDSNLMLKYVDFFNEIRLKNGTQRDLAMLIYDSFKGHLEESVKKKFCDNRFDLVVIPDGLTSIYQPLDILINKLFKDNLYKEWHIWIAGNGAGKTVIRNFRCARISNVCLWVKCFWEAISDEIIFKSFKTCKILMDLNESDSDLEISDDNSINGEDDVNDNNGIDSDNSIDSDDDNV